MLTVYVAVRQVGYGGRLFVRYIGRYIAASQRHDSAPRLTAAASEALAMLDAMANHPDYNVVMDFQPGDMQFVNNYHVLHARTAFEDHPEPGRKRFLKRLWLETRKLTDRPPQFRLASSAKAWSSRTGSARRPRCGCSSPARTTQPSSW